MPHMITQRPRLAAVASRNPTNPAHLSWERLNAIVYNVGGAIFVAGSVLFFPRFAAWENLGAWLFFVGSLLFLLVTGHDFIETAKFWRHFASAGVAKLVEAATAAAYLFGTLMFAAGSLFFLSWWGWYEAGAWLFVAGSALFAYGASGNLLQIIQAPDAVRMQLLNLTAAAFLVGSVLFIVGSVPYLWHLSSPVDRHLLFDYLAWEYLVGSALFLCGGIINDARRRIARRETLSLPFPEDLFAGFVRREVRGLLPDSRDTD